MARRLLHYILSTESVAQTGNGDKTVGMNASKANSDIKKQKTPSGGSALITEGRTQSGTTASGVAELEIRGTPNVPQEQRSAAKREDRPAVQVSTDAEKRSFDVIAKALQIISEESGIAREELTDVTVLAAVGIDSLLSLMIASRFKDELALDFEASMFHDLDTIMELKVFLAQTQGCLQLDKEAENITVPDPTDAIKEPGNIALHTHPEQESFLAADTEHIASKWSSQEEEVFAKVVLIISEETGISVKEITDDTVFVDAGIDSLLSLMISGRLRDELNLDINIDGAIFHDYGTVRELKNYLIPPNEKTEGAVHVISSSTSSDSLVKAGEDDVPNSGSVTSEESSTEDYVEIPKAVPSHRRATSIILQGRPWMSSKTLFLFPDGAGSASSYTNIPKIHADLALIGLNCPYVRYPSEMTCPLDALIKCYMDEIRRRQPHGPYNLGGWSAGGILAYRAAQMLIQAGEKVESLIFIDSPVPKGLDRLPRRFYDHCKSIGLFGKALPGPSPFSTSQLYEHFDATIEVLHNYNAKPLPHGHVKRATIIWAAEAVMDGVRFPKLPPGPGDTEGMRFLTEKRTDFSAAGWQDLFPGTVVDVKRASETHHFALMVSYSFLRLNQGS